MDSNSGVKALSHVVTFAESLVPVAVEMLLDGQTQIPPPLSHQATGVAALNSAALYDAIKTVLPAALEIVLEGMRENQLPKSNIPKASNQTCSQSSPLMGRECLYSIPCNGRKAQYWMQRSARTDRPGLPSI
ncbi:hypothetical protein QBC32DRAFT_328172 [Pseudoneurospora amorphoporcata]|uniref:Uncharacterized protein n=1 Tax=Pseudoneurospora amorphoporcata TaxID=241081 RepID=A0AAN6SCJ6_9PEZI|nr:hypothetical protein QBC32DRAFT_328172 [Pseudoneurospora amorphoporcata]